MRKTLLILTSGVFLFVFFGLFSPETAAQENNSLAISTGNGAMNFDLIFRAAKTAERDSFEESAQIKGIRVTGERSGVAFTENALFLTADNGASWRELVLPRAESETISAVYFSGKESRVILADRQNARLTLVKTEDGGISWTRYPVALRPDHFAEASLDDVEIIAGSSKNEPEAGETLKIRLASSSNFLRQAFYKSFDGGQRWEFAGHSMVKNQADSDFTEKIENENVIAKSEFGGNRWFLTSSGNCESLKSACWQETKIYASGGEITVPQIKELAQRKKANARLEAERSVFAQPPGGTTRISLNRGFDKCTAATAAQMQTWWNASPFYDANIYISGRNRGCSQPQLTAAWVNTVSAQGWGLIPTIVGYQSPCSVSTNSAKHSSDPVVAEQQGRGEADIAIADANALGLTQGTVLYYDMERYDDLSGTGACSTPTKAFLKGWTDRVKELGYISGVYGSPTNAVNDWLNIPLASRMDAVWLARWDNVPSVWFYASPSPVVPETAWNNHQRIKQWQAPHNETWGGVTFNIDGNIADGPVAGIAIAKNKRADFDGDGKTDVSVWRPETGTWYVTNSSNSSYTILNFGLTTDILTPGDFDGDGKTDFAVWRPENGVWHLYSRSIYRSFVFGTNGDVPVPADYDGDGRTDAAVFRPSTGTWYIWNSFDSRGTSYSIVQFGVTGDKPVPADYDGDGKADIAIYRPSAGEWWIQRSSNATVYAFQFGAAADKPVPGDFTGDGRADAAFFRPSDGYWYILRSEDSSFYSVPFGQSGDLAVPGDYDGDGKFDVGVFRPETSVWYVSLSQSGTLITQFGAAADKPVPAAYTAP